MSSLGADDMVFYKEGEKVMSGGFLVDSIMLQKGGAPMQTIQNNDENNEQNNDNEENKGVDAITLSLVE